MHSLCSHRATQLNGIHLFGFSPKTTCFLGPTRPEVADVFA